VLILLPVEHVDGSSDGGDTIVAGNLDGRVGVWDENDP
jgi:hypothetical protein